ncbi:unnamed protein product [Arctogadus glacialis]
MSGSDRETEEEEEEEERMHACVDGGGMLGGGGQFGRTRAHHTHHTITSPPGGVSYNNQSTAAVSVCLRHPDPVGQKLNCTEVDSPPPSGSTRNNRVLKHGFTIGLMSCY